MKQLLSVFGVVLFLVLTSTLVAFMPHNTANSPATYKIMEVVFLWDLLKSDYEPIRERDDTWLNVGFRSKYAMAKRYASLKLVESAFECDVFLRGPHKKDMNFNSQTAFGYHNPEFIERFAVGLGMALENPSFKAGIHKVYDEHLASMAKTYHNAYIYLNQDPDYLETLQAEYLRLMASAQGIDSGSFQETFRNYAEALEQEEGADVYEAFTAPAFWLRRSIDGTAAQWFELLDELMKEMEK